MVPESMPLRVPEAFGIKVASKPLQAQSLREREED